MEMKWVCLFLLPWAFVELSGQVACWGPRPAQACSLGARPNKNMLLYWQWASGRQQCTWGEWSMDGVDRNDQKCYKWGLRLVRVWWIGVFTSDWERCYSPPEWAWVILHQSVWGWSCLLGTRHNPPAPENYKGACPCQGFRSGQKNKKTQAWVTLVLHLLTFKRLDLHRGSQEGPGDTYEAAEVRNGQKHAVKHETVSDSEDLCVMMCTRRQEEEASEQLKRERTKTRGLRGRRGTLKARRVGLNKKCSAGHEKTWENKELCFMKVWCCE